jgi:hypothetical protein
MVTECRIIIEVLIGCDTDLQFVLRAGISLDLPVMDTASETLSR